ncbi:glycoside hydrolase family 16 protein [Nocardioides sp. Leaf285]|uniref:glycoside hydrolase family 16 protein n=1 Tax=Nocardioides sp. Leaf285 TaxID=1736322 RepID=UPI0007029B18|nr:glycoside hydrolase family 16 protein [Nocardioides sp. Leaf285]KQP65649.1 hypothetical protein ASF47_07810 [Nocardioides sp. Leaf285]
MARRVRLRARRSLAALGLGATVLAGCSACSGAPDAADPADPSGPAASSPAAPASPVSPGEEGAVGAPGLVWSDEFDGEAGAPPDPAVWQPDAFGHGGGNNELQCYTDDPTNASLDGQGHLVVSALSAPDHTCADGTVRDYTSARLTTESSLSWQYGRLEVRAQVPAGVGTWPAFWAMGTDRAEVGWPRSGEIDVMEHVGRSPTLVTGSIHGPTEAGTRWQVTREHDAGAPLSDGFHTYAVDWGPDGLEWELDGRPWGGVSRAEAEQLGLWAFDKPFYLLLNLAIGGDLGGPVPPETPFPQYLVVDHVRVYQ